MDSRLTNEHFTLDQWCLLSPTETCPSVRWRWASRSARRQSQVQRGICKTTERSSSAFKNSYLSEVERSSELTPQDSPFPKFPAGMLVRSVFASWLGFRRASSSQNQWVSPTPQEDCRVEFEKPRIESASRLNVVATLTFRKSLVKRRIFSARTSRCTRSLLCMNSSAGIICRSTIFKSASSSPPSCSITWKRDLRFEYTFLFIPHSGRAHNRRDCEYILATDSVVQFLPAPQMPSLSIHDCKFFYLWWKTFSIHDDKRFNPWW